MRRELEPFKVLIVKVGSKILTSKSLSRTKRIKSLVEDIITLRSNGVQVVLVSSGAIAHGMLALNSGKIPNSIPMKQACASIGQIKLMHMYEKLFSMGNTTIGQVLLSWADLHNKKSYLNLRNTLFTLMENDVVPIINENDSVAVDEIKFGDNDTLAAQIAMLVNADLFVNLTDINGLYDANPRKNSEAKFIPLIKKITPSIHHLAEEDGSSLGVGGMVTKLKAAEIVCSSGIQAIVGNGYTKTLLQVLENELYGTLFVAAKEKMSSKRRWITFTSKTKGTIVVDNGAQKAILEKGKSLLPAGIKSTDGGFNVGDMVEICTLRKKTFARGIVNFSEADTKKIMGYNTRDIEKILGFKSYQLVVHRNNMVLL